MDPWDSVTASYDVVGLDYERSFAGELAAKPRDRELLTRFASDRAGPIVDVGCGPGHVGEFVRLPDRAVFGLDPSSVMARLAGSRLDGTIRGDMRSLPFRSSSLGGLLAFYSVIHVPRPELGAVLHEFCRVLRPGGRVLIAAHEGDGEANADSFLGHEVVLVATLVSVDEMVGAARHARLDVVTAERREPYPGESTARVYVLAQKPAAA